MAQRVQLERLADVLQMRVQKHLSRAQPDSPELRAGLFRVALLIEAEAKLNLRRKGIVDTGRLLNSITHEFYQNDNVVGVRVGSFGVPYAAIHEFGGPFTDRQRRAMFAALKDRGKLAGPRVSKGVIQGSIFKSRPFLRPAFEKHSKRIVRIIREALK